MKKHLLKIILIALFGLAYGSSLKAQSVAFYGGISTPNDEVNNVYNSSTSIPSLREKTELGYHIGARARMPLAASFLLSGGVSWNRFPETSVYVVKPNSIDPKKNDTLAGIGTEQNIVPVALGLDYVIFNKGLGMFIGGELAYNYIGNTTTVIYNNQSIPLDEPDEVQNRVGGGIGLGVFFDAKIATAIVDLKYNMINLIGKEDNEPAKNYVTLSVGLMLGGMSNF
ncbi:MAG: hypothetical protein V4642_05870 [Bacteroidota bacterium]